ncbi:bifunctional DNA primase/polymerase [Micromonospora sp. CA-111912]|uniref:bifunctional DNA primase/polymerase n=1 Tax=Micromonospora sp. CA-111912 TaxID=3239955 RepID=UPI003D93FDFB
MNTDASNGDRHNPDIWAASTLGKHPEELRLPHEYIQQGVPVFVAAPSRHSDREFDYPRKWPEISADLCRLDRWRPGLGLAVCAVTGVRFDVIDIDPRNGGDESFAGLRNAGLIPPVYGEVQTPSGGVHLYVARSNLGNCKPVPGIEVQAGDNNGRGRGMVFIPPTIRASKSDNTKKPYTASRNIDWIGLQEGSEHPDFQPWLEFLQRIKPVRRPVNRATGIIKKADEPITGLEDLTNCSLTEEERKQRYFEVVAIALVKEMLEAREGSRNNTLNALAFRLGSVAGLGMPVEQVAAALAAAALKTGLPAVEVAGTTESGLKAGLKHPMVWNHS